MRAEFAKAISSILVSIKNPGHGSRRKWAQKKFADWTARTSSTGLEEPSLGQR